MVPPARLTDVAPGDHVPRADGRVVMHDVPWSHDEVMLTVRGESGHPRPTWFSIKGAIEVDVLEAGTFQQRERSTWFPELDLAQLSALLLEVGVRPTSAIVRGFRTALAHTATANPH